jgi:hypothetical protein
MHSAMVTVQGACPQEESNDDDDVNAGLIVGYPCSLAFVALVALARHKLVSDRATTAPQEQMPGLGYGISAAGTSKSKVDPQAG